MANKTYAAKKYFSFKCSERRLVREIDKRTKKGPNENTSNVMAKYATTKEGDRVWSF